MGSSTQRPKSLYFNSNNLAFLVTPITNVYKISDIFNLKKILPILEKI